MYIKIYTISLKKDINTLFSTNALNDKKLYSATKKYQFPQK